MVFKFSRNMNVCRVCLASETDKDINEIRTNKHLEHKSFADVMLFCLDVQITHDSKLSTKLCTKCYRKIKSFHKFKSLAKETDSYLKSLNSELKNEDLLTEEVQVKLELIDDEEIKKECGVNDGELSQDFQSDDDELLSVMKNIKYEFVTEEAKENEPVKRKRGRPKKTSIKIKVVPQTQICEECGKTVKNLREHMQRHLPASSRKRYQCGLCDKSFACAGGKYRHVKRKHLGIKQHCKVCNKEVTNLKQHTQVIHNTDALPFECVACKRRFLSKSKLDLHMNVHTKDRPFTCEECNKRFRTKTTVMLHRRQVHEKEKTHICQFCSKSFFKKYHLQLHIRTHTKEKPHVCPDCGKSFSSTSTLNNHRLIHAEIKMFGCDLCSMSFVRPGYLRAHMLSHTKEKRYPCRYCSVKFHRSDHRKRHEYRSHQQYLTIGAT